MARGYAQIQYVPGRGHIGHGLLVMLGFLFIAWSVVQTIITFYAPILHLPFFSYFSKIILLSKVEKITQRSESVCTD